MNKKYTSEGLPILTEETFKAYTAELNRNTNGKDFTLSELLNGISDKLMRDYIIYSSERYSPQLRVPILVHLTGLYKLLQLQGNNYKINQFWNVDDFKED